MANPCATACPISSATRAHPDGTIRQVASWISSLPGAGRKPSCGGRSTNTFEAGWPDAALLGPGGGPTDDRRVVNTARHVLTSARPAAANPAVDATRESRLPALDYGGAVGPHCRTGPIVSDAVRGALVIDAARGPMGPPRLE